MQSTQDWQGEDLAIIVMGKDRLTIPLWDLLVDALMRSGSIKVLNIGAQGTLQLLLLQDQQVIEALPSHTAEKPLTDGIGSRGVIGRFQDLDAAGLGNPHKGHAKLAIVIPDEILRPNTKGRGFAKLLGRPRGSRENVSRPHGSLCVSVGR